MNIPDKVPHLLVIDALALKFACLEIIHAPAGTIEPTIAHRTFLRKPILKLLQTRDVLLGTYFELDGRGALTRN